jgi:hypothetical protein
MRFMRQSADCRAESEGFRQQSDRLNFRDTNGTHSDQHHGAGSGSEQNYGRLDWLDTNVAEDGLLARRRRGSVAGPVLFPDPLALLPLRRWARCGTAVATWALTSAPSADPGTSTIYCKGRIHGSRCGDRRRFFRRPHIPLSGDNAGTSCLPILASAFPRRMPPHILPLLILPHHMSGHFLFPTSPSFPVPKMSFLDVCLCSPLQKAVVL